MASCLLALGSNLGDSKAALEQAIGDVGALAATSVASHSTFHATRPVGGPAGQGEFLNAAAVVETTLQPQALLAEVQRIEDRLGRRRTRKWSARTLDIDLLLYDQRIVDEPNLVVPHPRMSFRPFVLAPAVEVARHWRHPVLDATVGEFWHRLQTGDDAILIYGGTRDDRQWHAQRLIASFAGMRFLEPSDEADCRLLCGSGSSTAEPKLAIQLRTGREAPRAGNPTLVLPAGSRESVEFDAVAAVECVWPDLGRRIAAG